MLVTCTSCGAQWHAEDYYTSKGVIKQPCAECRKDSSSIYYNNNRDAILEARYQAYHDPATHEAKKAYFAAKRREYRAAKRASR